MEVVFFCVPGMASEELFARAGPAGVPTTDEDAAEPDSFVFLRSQEVSWVLLQTACGIWPVSEGLEASCSVCRLPGSEAGAAVYALLVRYLNMSAKVVLHSDVGDAQCGQRRHAAQ